MFAEASRFGRNVIYRIVEAKKRDTREPDGKIRLYVLSILLFLLLDSPPPSAVILIVFLFILSRSFPEKSRGDITAFSG